MVTENIVSPASQMLEDVRDQISSTCTVSGLPQLTWLHGANCCTDTREFCPSLGEAPHKPCFLAPSSHLGVWQLMFPPDRLTGNKAVSGSHVSDQISLLVGSLWCHVSNSINPPKKKVAIQKFNPPIIFVERLVFTRHFRFVHALVVPRIWRPKSKGSYYHPKHCRFVRVCPISRQIHIPKSQLWLILSGFCLEVLICLMVAAHPHKPVMVFFHLCCLHPNFARKCWKVTVCLRVSHATFFPRIHIRCPKMGQIMINPQISSNIPK